MERQAKDGTIYEKVGDDSWSPVTRTAKDGTVYKKVGADSWSPMQAAQPQAPPQSSWLDTQVPVVGGTVGGHIQGTLDALPVMGTVAGGGIGGMIGAGTGGFSVPVVGAVPGAVAGGIAGAGAGAAIGEQLKNAGEKLIFGKDHTRAELYGGPAKAAVQGMSGEMGGQAIGGGLGMAAETKAGQALIGKLGSGAAKVGELFTGVPSQEINTFAKNAPEIEQLSAANDHNTQDIADAIRGKVNDIISAHKAEMNGKISKALADNTGQIESKPIIDRLEQAKSQINSKLRPDEVGEVDDLIGKVNAVSKDGKMSLQDAHDLKEYLSEQAKGTYQKGGQIFQRGEKAAQAAKSGAGATRELLNAAAPEVADANGSLSRLHDIEDVMNKSMLAEGKTASPLMAAGAGTNSANAKILKQLGQETGTDVLGEAQKLAAARTFGKPGLMPIDSTGKAVGRMGLASGIGFLAGGVPGAVIAGGLTSPAALKVAIKAGRAAGSESGQAIASTIGRSIIDGKLLDTTMSKDAAPGAPTNQNSTPEMQLTKPATKGPDKWANDGLKKLIEHAGADGKDALGKLDASKVDQSTKELLMRASDLTPGSKAMDKILIKLKERMSSKLAGDDD